MRNSAGKKKKKQWDDQQSYVCLEIPFEALSYPMGLVQPEDVYRIHESADWTSSSQDGKGIKKQAEW